MNKAIFLLVALILLSIIPIADAISPNDSEADEDINACTTDEYCQVNNLGSECTNGVCAFVSQPYNPPELCLGFIILPISLLGALLIFNKPI